MITTAIVLNTSKKLSNNVYTVSLRITDNRKPRYITLNDLVSDPEYDFKCSTDDWVIPGESGLGAFHKRVKNYKQLNSILAEQLIKARNLLKQYKNDNIEYDFEYFKADILNKKKLSVEHRRSLKLEDYYNIVITELEENHRIGSASIYRSTLSSLKEFRSDLLLTDINVKFLNAFESWSREIKGNKDTSISVKIRNLQRVLNLAISDKLISQDQYPFGEKKYSVNKKLNHKTRKRSVPLEVVAEIKKLNITKGSPLELARNIFMFSFYTRGMNFIDIAKLKWSDIESNIIYYIRKKTGQPFEIPINKHIQMILDYYKSNNQSSQYIFPIYNDVIHTTEKARYKRKHGMLKTVNDNLKEIAKLIGQENLKLTTYVSRHSYATNLKRSGVATSYISEALGHQTEEMTQTYLDEFEKGVISDLESKIFDL